MAPAGVAARGAGPSVRLACCGSSCHSRRRRRIGLTVGRLGLPPGTHVLTQISSRRTAASTTTRRALRRPGRDLLHGLRHATVLHAGPTFWLARRSLVALLRSRREAGRAPLLRLEFPSAHAGHAALSEAAMHRTIPLRCSEPCAPHSVTHARGSGSVHPCGVSHSIGRRRAGWSFLRTSCRRHLHRSVLPGGLHGRSADRPAAGLLRTAARPGRGPCLPTALLGF
jgi:hypothetical protein